MNVLAQVLGIVGSIILVIGAAWSERKKEKAMNSVKDWLFTFGGLFMLLYAITNCLLGGSIFFVFLEILLMVSSILMMLETNETFDTVVIAISATILLIWSIIISGTDLILFVVGLCAIGYGYILKPATAKRELCLSLGSLAITFFSFYEGNTVFFILNFFFALFSAYHFFDYYLLRNRLVPRIKRNKSVKQNR